MGAGLVRIRLNLNIFILMFIREVFVTCKNCDFKSLVHCMLSGFNGGCMLYNVFVCWLFLGNFVLVLFYV